MELLEMLNLNSRISFKLTMIIWALVSLSCSHRDKNVPIGKHEHVFLLKDRSGEFLYKREVKINTQEVATRISVMNPNNTTISSEKTVSISRLGIISQNKVLRPTVSQHTIWYEKEKYFSQLKTNIKKKTLDIIMQSPEDKWQGNLSLEYPSAKVFCFFTQIPECVQFYGMLTSDPEASFNLVIIWDNYPYHTEAYAQVADNPFQNASFSFDGEYKNGKRYKLQMSNQIIFYEFDVNKQFDKMYWIAQGITLVRKK